MDLLDINKDRVVRIVTPVETSPGHVVVEALALDGTKEQWTAFVTELVSFPSTLVERNLHRIALLALAAAPHANDALQSASRGLLAEWLGDPKTAKAELDTAHIHWNRARQNSRLWEA